MSFIDKGVSLTAITRDPRKCACFKREISTWFGTSDCFSTSISMATRSSNDSGDKPNSAACRERISLIVTSRPLRPNWLPLYAVS